MIELLELLQLEFIDLNYIMKAIKFLNSDQTCENTQIVKKNM